MAKTGSFTTSLTALEGATAKVVALLGSAPADGTPASGLAGAAALLDPPPTDRVGALAETLGERLPDVLRFDAANLAPAMTLFPELGKRAQRPPQAAADAFGERLEAAGDALAKQLLDDVTQRLGAMRSISEAIPSDPATVVAALVDQLVGVSAALEGPEAERINGWAQSLKTMHRELAPLLEQAANSDGGALAVTAIQRALDATLETLGFPRAQQLVSALARIALEQALVDAAVDALDDVKAAYAKVAAAKDAPFADFGDAVVEAGEALVAARRQLRPLLATARRVRDARILQPGAVAAELRALIDHAAGVRIDDVAKVDDPFKTLLDRIDEAIAKIDLGPVREGVLGFFKDLRTTIEGVDLPHLGDELAAALAPANAAVSGLRDGLGDIQREVVAFVDGLATGVHDAAGAVGSFRPDGSFEFALERDLRALLQNAHVAIAGDPEDPQAPSVAGALKELDTLLGDLFKQLGTVLGSVVDAVTGAVEDAKKGLKDFAEYVEGLKLGDVSETLRDEVQKIVDALDAIDFDPLVDEVVGVLDDNAEKLRGIEPPAMNELLRAALKAVLQVFVDFKFVKLISDPLEAKLAELADLPAKAVDDLQHRWEQALATLDALHPEKLLEPLLSAVDTIDEAVGTLKLETLLAPLDALHDEHLKQPFERLDPVTLLEPVSRGFRDYAGALDRLHGEDIVAPLAHQLAQLQKQIAAVDVDRPLADLLTALETAKRDLAATKPSVLLKPLTDEVTRLLGALDAIKPSTLLGPAAALATPLLEQLEHIQQQTIDAIYALFQAPLAVLEELDPERLEDALRTGLDAVIEAIQVVRVRPRFDALKATQFDVARAVAADPDRAALIALLDPEPQLGRLVAAHDELLADLAKLRAGVDLGDLAAVYADLRERLGGLLPPYARKLLDPNAFKFVMQLADPTRFAAELDARFAAVRATLVPVTPEELAGELDATWASALGVIAAIDLTDLVAEARALVKELKDAIAGLRVDFLAADADRALADLRAVAAALDPARAAAALAPLHADLATVLAATRPSKLLAGLAAELDKVTAKVGKLDLRTSLGDPLLDVWEQIDAALHALDLRIALAPITDRLAELAHELEAGLDRTAEHFTAMVAAGKAAL